MNPITTIHDLHIGTQRSAGTTTVSAKKLREYANEQLGNLLDKIGTDLVVNGDLFDGFQIPLSDALVTLKHFNKWLEKGKRLFLIPGNHDLSNDSSKLSTFEFIAQILHGHPNCYHHKGGGWLDESEGLYAISHVANQDLFDLELSKVPECEVLFLHCNWDNGFAKELDHSLNLSADAAKDLAAKRIVIAHEHQSATHLNGKVIIPGNHFPMSIADCIGSQGKFYVEITDTEVKRHPSWSANEFQQVDWKEVGSTVIDKPFVRVIGSAGPEEAALAVETVAKLRRASDAFVVGSAVKMLQGGATLDMTEALASVEDVRAFDVLGELKKLLRPDQVAVLEKLK